MFGRKFSELLPVAIAVRQSEAWWKKSRVCRHAAAQYQTSFPTQKWKKNASLHLSKTWMQSTMEKWNEWSGDMQEIRNVESAWMRSSKRGKDVRKRLHRRRNIREREKSASQDAEEGSLCRGAGRRGRNYPPPPNRMTLRSNSVICQPHRHYSGLMDWEGMRDTGLGNPSVVICGRHYQTY